MAARAVHSTLTASSVATVSLSELGGVEVLNRDGSAEIYFTVGSSSQPPADPTVGGDDTYVVPAGVTSYVVPFPEDAPPSGGLEVKLISSGTPTYSVIGIGSVQR